MGRLKSFQVISLSNWRNIFGRRFLWLFLALLVVVVVAFIWRQSSSNPDLPPRQMLKRAIALTSSTPSFAYHTETRTIINGREEYVSKIDGERETPDRVHLRGVVLGSDLDFYQLGDTTFTRDQFSDRWIVFRGNPINQSEIFMSELNPLSNFNFEDPGEVKYLGRDTAGGVRCWLYQARPRVNNPYLALLWKDFEYIFWVRPGDGRIQRVEVKGVSKNNPRDTIHILINFDYSVQVKLKPPVQKTSQEEVTISGQRAGFFIFREK